MAQVNFLFSDDGLVVSGANGNTTSAITAGDILYASSPSTSPFGTTVPGGVDYDEVEVEPIKFATAVQDISGGRIVGVALHDAPKSTTTLSRIAFLTEGLFLSPVGAFEGTTTAGVTNVGTTTGPTAVEQKFKCGIALTAANVSGHYILWKFTR